MRGRCKVQSADFKDGIADYSKAIDLNPKNADFCKHRASAYGLLRQFDPAIVDGEMSLKLTPATLCRSRTYWPVFIPTVPPHTLGPSGTPKPPRT